MKKLEAWLTVQRREISADVHKQSRVGVFDFEVECNFEFLILQSKLLSIQHLSRTFLINRKCDHPRPLSRLIIYLQLQ